MEHLEIDFQANESEIAYRPQRLRWVVWGLMIFSAVMIGLLVLSQTRISRRAQSHPMRLSGLTTPPRASAGLTAAFVRAVEMADSAPPQVAPDAPASRPQVSAMPADRVPVRRAGIAVRT